MGFQNAEVFKVEKLLPVRSNGKFIFSEIDVYPENEGLLPYNLTFNDNLPSLVKKLGNIIEDFTGMLPEKRVVTFFYDSLVIVIFFDSHNKINLIRFYIPDIYDKKTWELIYENLDMNDINGVDFIEFIGEASDNPLFLDFLDNVNIYDLPFPPEEDESFIEYPAVAYARSRDSMNIEVERYSLRMIYGDNEGFNLLYNKRIIGNVKVPQKIIGECDMANNNWRISDELWEKMRPLIPEHKTSHPLGRHRKRVDNRSAINAIFFVPRTSCQWNALNATQICSSSSVH